MKIALKISSYQLLLLIAGLFGVLVTSTNPDLHAQSSRPRTSAATTARMPGGHAVGSPKDRLLPKSVVARAAWQEQMLKEEDVPAIPTNDIPPMPVDGRMTPQTSIDSGSIESGHAMVESYQSPGLTEGEYREMNPYHDQMRCGPSPCVLVDWTRTSIFVGVQGFSNAPNYAGTAVPPLARDGSGSFGFHEGFNWGQQLPGLFCGELGMQFGLRGVQANLAGAEFTPDSRGQLFLSAGLFRRVDIGLQAGFTIDYLADQWYLDTDLAQIRGELSYRFNPCSEFGFRFAASTQTSTGTGSIINDAGARVATTETFAALDQYRFFYRRTMGDDARSILDAQIGWTDHDQAILGLNLSTPLQGELGLQTNFTYLIPGTSFDPVAQQNEGWNIGLSLVWTPGRGFGSMRDYYQPLLDVADNGSMIMTRLQ